ncbi:MAG TPA: spore germination protein GerW family protein [Tepidiformaceae bacterium]|nr:spore germination protein GerW family protein [Tepidiformaceae bacterium]
MTLDYAKSEARQSAESLIDRITNRLGDAARAEVVFGDPVTQDGVTVIPVAKVRWAFGGGAGAGGDEKKDGEDYGEGGGGGGGVSASPVGFIEIVDGRAEYRPIKDIAGMWPTLLAGAVAFWITLRGLRALFR